MNLILKMKVKILWGQETASLVRRARALLSVDFVIINIFCFPGAGTKAAHGAGYLVQATESHTGQ